MVGDSEDRIFEARTCMFQNLEVDVKGAFDLLSLRVHRATEREARRIELVDEPNQLVLRCQVLVDYVLAAEAVPLVVIGCTDQLLALPPQRLQVATCCLRLPQAVEDGLDPDLQTVALKEDGREPG